MGAGAFSATPPGHAPVMRHLLAFVLRGVVVPIRPQPDRPCGYCCCVVPGVAEWYFWRVWPCHV
ncbi:hypothetical protein ATCC53582_02340 [Novacetimonas hansenii]|nr:hypothetical protein ATCC53582_02340 [Novacetimonas hansenii]